MAIVPTVRVVRRRHERLPDTIEGPRRVKVGFVAGESPSGSINKAVWNEFGTRGGASGGGWGGPIPERPFMRNAMRANAGKYRAALRSSAAKILKGKEKTETVLRKLGNLAQDDIKAEITSLSSPPNSPVTIKLKGSSNPLIDTGEMRGDVRYKVEK